MTFCPPANFKASPHGHFASLLDAAALNAHAAQWTTISIDLQTITPLYGGGSIAGEVDATVPFRPRAIKNAIRHWWWLIHRGDAPFAKDSTKLHAEMSRLFGSAESSDTAPPGLVRVRVTPPDHESIRVRLKRYFPWSASQNGWGQNAKDPWCYALFAARGEQRATRERGGWTDLLQALKIPAATSLVPYDPSLNLSAWFKVAPHPLLTEGLKFSAQIDLHKSKLSSADQAQIADAVRAWVSLGGLGARTTRGLGVSKVLSWAVNGGDASLAVKPAWSSADEFQIWLASLFPAATVAIDDVGGNSALQVWERATERYRKFRQARQTRPGPTPARSYWPKVHVALDLGAIADRNHIADHPAVTSAYKPLPELFFGAPIEVSMGGNRKTIVTFDGAERFTSPLLLRPLRIGDRFHAAAIVLPFLGDIGQRAAKVGQFVLPYAQWWYSSDQLAEAMLKHLPPARNDKTNADPRDDLISAARDATNPLSMFLHYFDEHRPVGYD